MSPFQEIAIRLLLSIESAPQDFTDGLLNALREDEATGESIEVLANLMARVEQLRSHQIAGNMAGLLLDLHKLHETSKRLDNHEKRLQEIIRLATTLRAGAFSDRIVMEKVSKVLTGK